MKRRCTLCSALRAVVFLGMLQQAETLFAAPAALELSIRAGSEAGGLDVRVPRWPGEVFDFRTCEGVITGSRDLGLFQVKLPAEFGSGHRSWKREGKVWSYTWPYAAGVEVRVTVEPEGESLKLAYRLTNTGSNTLDAVQLHTCIPTTEAPSFFPRPAVRQSGTNWTELYQRLHLWSGGRSFTFAETCLAASQVHLGLVRRGAAPVRWSWWVNGPETFDLPLIALTSRDGHRTVALAFEQAIWASSNVGDDRACFHLFPWFGRIEPGRSVTVRGRLYFLEGGPEVALARFERDFPRIAAAAARGEAALPQAELATEGKTKWRIHLPRDASLTERFAGQELSRYLEQITGAQFSPTDHPGRYTVQIARRSALLGSKDLPAPKPGHDGYSLLVEPRRIVIAGDSPIGVLYGVYDLLERLGCRWFQPTLDPKDPEVVPRQADLSLPCGAWSEASPLRLRIYNGSAFFFDLKPEQMIPQLDWAAKNRYNGVSWQAHHRPGAVGEEMELMKASGVLAELDQRGLFLHGPCHSFPYFLPSAKYFEQHPEWFGMLDGKRCQHGERAPLVNYCWSNPEANREFIRNVEVFLQQYPQIKVFCPVWIDGGKLCGCESCQGRGGSDLIVDLFNALSDRLEVACPGVRLEAVCGYAPALEPPTQAVPNGKWQAVYAHWGRNHRQSYGDPDYSNRQSLATWRAAFKNFELCSYYAAASHQPFNGPPFLHALRADTDFFIRQNLVGTYVLQYPHGFWWNYAFDLGVAGRYPYYYPDQTPHEQLRDYALQYFGPDAGPVLLDVFRALSDDLEVSYRASRGDATERDYQQLKAWAETIKSALALCQHDQTFAYRVRKLQAGHRMLTRWSTALRHVRSVQQKYQAFKDQGAPREEVTEAIAAADRYAANVLAEAAQTEARFPGTITAEWLESWYVNRVFRAPIKEIERRLGEPQ